MAGLTNAGFTVKALQEILTEIQQAQRDRIDPSINNATTTPLGQLNGITSEREALLWELLRLAYNAFDSDAAEGWLLDMLCSLTGTTRRTATRSLVPCFVNLDAGVTLPQFSTAHVLGQPTRLFRSRVAVVATTAGDYPVVFESIDTGPVVANAGTLTQIAGPVTGWNSVNNLNDAVEGRNVELDDALRARRSLELQKIGGSTPDAIRSDVIDVDGVISCTVYENLSDTADPVSGLPAFAIEVLVFDGVIPQVSNDVIAQAIWNSRAGGAGTFGSFSGTAVDSEGNPQTVYFSRPTIKPVWIDATVKMKGPAPSDATTQMRDALVEDANKIFTTDTDVVALEMKCLLLDMKEELGFSWIFDVPSLRLGFAASPTNEGNLTITPREIPRLDTSRTTITII